jgi:hypothetical protein
MFFSKTEQIIPDFKLCYERHFQRLQTHVKSIPEQSPTGCVKYHIRCGNIIQSDHKKRLKAINFTLCFCCGSFGKQLNPSANYEINTKVFTTMGVDLPQVGLERNASSERERRSRSREADLSYLQRAKFY